MMMLNVCVDLESDASIRNSETETELDNAVVATLNKMEGPCLTSIAALAGLSVQTVYNVRRRNRKANPATMTVLLGVLVPGYVPTFKNACAVRNPMTPPPVIEWREVAGHPAYRAKFVNGKFSGKASDIALATDLASQAVSAA